MPVTKIASWNINSVRARIDIVSDFLTQVAPDVLCLQETKVDDPTFPHEPFERLGYVHRLLAGQRMHHGVAILSRLPLHAHGRHDWQDNGEARHVGACLPNGIRLENVYVPAGGDVPDPELNVKFAHKLQFLSETADWFTAKRQRKRPMILVGDLNIAPLEHDVWSHKQLLKVVSHTPIEVEHLGRLQKTLGWVDAIRHFVPETEKLYSWWSYRNRDWAASDRGRRLDHIWVTPALAGGLREHHVARAVRGWEPATDHVPVTATLEL